MKNINNKRIVFGFKIMVILILGVMVIPATTNAQYGGYVTTGPNQNTNNPSSYPNYYQTPIYISEPVYIPTPAPVVYVNPAPTPTVYSNSTNPNKVASAPAKIIAKAKTEPVKDVDTDKSLTAGAIFGSDSFMPSNIIQWIFFAILILLMVILARKI